MTLVTLHVFFFSPLAQPVIEVFGSKRRTGCSQSTGLTEGGGEENWLVSGYRFLSALNDGVMCFCCSVPSSEWDLSMDEILLFSRTRAISPASSVFTLGPRDSPMKGEHHRKGEFQLSRLLDSQQSYSEEAYDMMFMDSPTPPARIEQPRRISATLSRAPSPVKPRKISHRPKSAVSSKRTSSSLSSSKRPKSAVTSRSQSQKHSYSHYQRSESKDSTATAEQLLSSLSRSSTPASRSAQPPPSPAAPSAAASGNTWDSVMQEYPRVENQHRSDSLRSSPRSSPMLENVEESLYVSSHLPGLPPSVCPPSCVCQFSQAERDAALRRKKRISFQDGQLPREDSDSGQLRRSSSSGSVSPVRGSEPGQLSELIDTDPFDSLACVESYCALWVCDTKCFHLLLCGAEYLFVLVSDLIITLIACGH